MNEQHHYYAATCSNWAVGSTRQDAIARVAKATGETMIKEQLKHNGYGMYVWSVKVLVPADVDYAINFWKPVDVPMEDPQEFRLVSAKGHVIPVD